MNETDALGLVEQAIWAVLIVSGPAVGLAMLLGTLIALFQAVTQIQEQTLTFVPKMFAVLLAMLLSSSLIASSLVSFSDVVFARIQTGF